LVVGRPVPAAEAGELKDGVDGDFERAGVALNLGEDKAALECGEEGDAEVVRRQRRQGRRGSCRQGDQQGPGRLTDRAAALAGRNRGHPVAPGTPRPLLEQFTADYAAAFS